MKVTGKLLHLLVLGMAASASLAVSAQADTVYLFVGDRATNPSRPGSIHRYAIDSANSSVLKAAPSAGLSDAYWDRSDGQPFKGMRLTDMVIGPDGDVYAVCRDTRNVIRFNGKTGAFKNEVVKNLDNPDGITIGPDGNLYVTNDISVVRTTLAGKPLPGAEQIGRIFTSGGNLVAASGLAFGPDGDLYVASQTTNTILHYDGKTGKILDVFHSGGIQSPSEIAWGPDGNLYVASTGGPGFNAQSGYIAKIDGVTGKKIDGFATDAKGAMGMAFAPDGNLLVTDYFGATLKRFDGKTGKLLNNILDSPTGSNFYYLALAKQADTPNAPLHVWNSPVPKRVAAKITVPKTALGASTVNGWKDALVPQGKIGPMLNLAAAKKTPYVVALSANPSTQDEKAAVTLAYWLGEMTGAKFPVVRESANAKIGTKVISIGKTAFWKAANLPEAKLDLKEEGYAIAAKGDDLFIWGGKMRGAIYGVEALLEEDLGVRWYTAEANGNRIPRVSALTFAPKLRHFVPALYVRDPHYADAFDAEWSLKNRTNAYNSPVPIEYGGYAKHALFVHTYNALVPPSEYFEKHPEYFAEIGGKRQPSQLELTNPDVLKIVVEKVKQFLRDNPGSQMISVSPNDGRGYSESKESRAIDEAEATVPGSKSGTLIWFVNQVAEAIEPEFPNVKISTLAYLDTFMPPKTIRPRKNVVIQLCTDSHAWKYQFCFTQESQQFQTALKAWHKIGAAIHIWDYTTSYIHFMVPMPNMPVVTSNIKFYIDHGAKGIMLQGNYLGSGGENSTMRSWVWAKQLWNPSLDTKSLMKDFIFGYYGDAAQPIWDYNMMLWDLWEENHKQPHVDGVTPIGVNKLIIDSPCSANPDWVLFDKTYLDKTTKYMNEAMALAKDPITKHRVEVTKLPLLYVKLGQGLGWITEFRDYHAGTWVKKGGGEGKAQYQAMYDEFMRIIKEAGVTNVSEHNPISAITDKWQVLLAQKYGEAPVTMVNPKWSFKPDPQDVGVAQNWAVAIPDKEWGDVYNNRNTGWESQGFKDYRGWAWYRQDYKLPDDFKLGKKLYLYFGAVDSESEVYLNGKRVFDHSMASTGMALDTIWNAPFSIDVTDLWKKGEANHIAVRVTSKGGVRGVWKPTFIVSPNNEMKTDDIQNLVVPYQ